MNLPPMIFQMKIIQPPKRKVSLWLPLFIIVPVVAVIAFALFLLLLPLILIAAVILWLLGLRWPLLKFIPAIRYIVSLMFAVRGLKVDVNKGTERVFISFS